MNVVVSPSDELIMLRKGKGDTCVTVTIPGHHVSPHKRTDKPVAAELLDKARHLLYDRYGKSDAEPVCESLYDLYNNIDFLHAGEGIGLYVSPRLKLLVQFPFRVKERITTGDSFEIRDLLYKTSYAVPYYVLVVSTKEGRLFKGCLGNLSEVTDGVFPAKNAGDDIYVKHVPGSSVEGSERLKVCDENKNAPEAIRLKDFFINLDESLDRYLRQDTPLIILGVKKELLLFYRVSRHKKQMAAKLPGNYTCINEKQLEDMTWATVRLHLKNQWNGLIEAFKEKSGEGHAVHGIRDCWHAIQLGKGVRLIAEKDYSVPGFVAIDDRALYLRPPKVPHRVLEDAVDEMMEQIIARKGEVFFVDNGLLREYGRVALFTRY